MTFLAVKQALYIEISLTISLTDSALAPSGALGNTESLMACGNMQGHLEGLRSMQGIQGNAV
jgi:hypothetical protein